MLSIYIPALISLLNIEQQSAEVKHTPSNVRLLSSSSAQQRAMLHDHSLKKLTEIGPKYSDEFKQIMASNSNYSENLKSAIRSQQQKSIANLQQNNVDSVEATKSNKNGSGSSSVNLPNSSFPLKVDFSKYK